MNEKKCVHCGDNKEFDSQWGMILTNLFWRNQEWVCWKCRVKLEPQPEPEKTK